ncbi:hypothetical protein [uncultured Actinomyces sp.]|uniref:hypothetical protein n=1 Tax=uncultured Actinomyces sp. TaxID=249061 RepID=UPI0028DB97BD|nr:hypothetical protein [uncultured Actinomyces sp.]
MIPLQAAWRTRDEWSRTLASLTAWTMSLTMDVELDWGPDEEWLTINKNGTWTGYLNADIPPLIRTDQLSCTCWPYPLQVIVLRTSDQPEMRCDMDVLIQCFKTEFNPFFDSSSFSATELWYATV